ncbi:NAD-dependent epimerase/dehydratase family protein [Candidatus Woesearchaeota archaeon]|nr:NAD-dependent epimerase/dehydratase family protein [Candidatus Woesearchaeota archaeon]
MDPDKKTVLVTGAAGFIGSHLSDALVAKGYNLIGVDNLQTGFLKNLEYAYNFDNFKFIKADVNNFNEISPIFYTFKPNFVYHYSATVGVKRTLEKPSEVLNDIDGIKNILLLSKSTSLEKVLFSSSSEVYGEPVTLPQNESTTPLNSRLPYAVVKNLGEVFLKTYQKEHNLNYTIFRFFNTFGPRQSENFVISKFIKSALKNEPITLYGDGTQTRTFIYIQDNINVTVQAIENSLFNNQTINIGSEKEITVKELAEKIILLTNSKSQITYLPALKEGDMTRRQPNTKLMQELTKNKLTDFEEGLKKTIEYFISH